MKMPKPTDGDKERFRALVPEAENVQVKPMFGSLAAFVNGNMFMGLHGDEVGIRLGEADKERLLAIDGAGPFGPGGRPMKAYVTLPAAWLHGGDDPQADAWVAKALEHTAAMPPKAKKTTKST